MTPHTVRMIAWAVLALLAAVLVAWPLQRLGYNGLWLGLVLALPLAMPARALARHARRGLQGGILLQALYLAIGLTEFIANNQARPWALATLLLSLVLCAAFLTLLRLPRP